MDLLDLLDEILAADEGRAAPTKPVPEEEKPNLGYRPCGIHLRIRDDEAHLVDCWRNVCPSCGDHVANGFVMLLNHEGADVSTCPSIRLRLNHLTASMRFNGPAPDEHDLAVIKLGYLIGPDGSQIHPDGHVDVCLPPHIKAERFARWMR